MSFDFLHPLMLAGLAGVALPILVHLLSRRNYDVVDWGAMQFLEMRRNIRRRMRLEHLLLLLLRMLLIALLAIALARPWVSGGWLAGLVPPPARDVVIVIDGSYSMAWEGGARTPHSAAVQRAHEILDGLQPGDTVALIDAREQARSVVSPPTREHSRVRRALESLPGPAGSANLVDGLIAGLRALNRGEHPSREMIVLTDLQAHGWSANDANAWARFDDQLSLAAVAPRIWVADLGSPDSATAPNVGVDRLKLSREMTAEDLPVRISTKLRLSGGSEPVQATAHLEVDGQQLAGESKQVQLRPGSEAVVEFEHRFRGRGSHVVAVVVDNDLLPADDRAEAAVTVADALPVLLVDGDPQLEPSRAESFFAAAALTPEGVDSPLVKTTVVPWDGWNAADLSRYQAVILANVPRVEEPNASLLKEFIAGGGGLIVAAGDRVDAEAYDQAFYNGGLGWLPAKLESIADLSPDTPGGLRVSDSSLELPWVARFRREHGGEFALARFTKWWNVTLPTETLSPREEEGERANETADNPGPTADQTAPIVAARLENGAPLFVAKRFGRGEAILSTVPFDADWSTLPTKADFVALLHEFVFHLAAHRVRQNVDTGTPLELIAPLDAPLENYEFVGPGGREFDVQRIVTPRDQIARLTDTGIAGLYEFRARAEHAGAPLPSVQFVVNGDRRESDLARLDDAAKQTLAANGRMSFVAEQTELAREMTAGDSRSELWKILLLVFITLLVSELLLTRRLVRGGHAVVDDADGAETEEPAAHVTALTSED